MESLQTSANLLAYKVLFLSHTPPNITHKGFDKVFLANLNSLWLQTYLSHVSFKELYTFDDGSDNIF
ncbi:glycosyltransferase family 52, partial [Haemophilus influenzae]|uniref:glycosyltransferase family 52 n=1 Tax=Haemophilus influenzae TaxID=727 RepID=UPI00311AB405